MVNLNAAYNPLTIGIFPRVNNPKVEHLVFKFSADIDKASSAIEVMSLISTLYADFSDIGVNLVAPIEMCNWLASKVLKRGASFSNSRGYMLSQLCLAIELDPRLELSDTEKHYFSGNIAKGFAIALGGGLLYILPFPLTKKVGAALIARGLVEIGLHADDLLEVFDPVEDATSYDKDSPLNFRFSEGGLENVE